MAMRQTYREDMPRFIEPMLAGHGEVPTTGDWAVEVKWDGIRAQLRWDGRKVCVRSRPGRNCTHEFPELEGIGDAVGDRTLIIDGELVCLGADGKPDFYALRARLGRPDGRRVRGQRSRSGAVLMCFDLLHLDGRAVRALPYWRRRELLDELELDGPFWRTPRHYIGETQAVITATRELGLEGVVAKRFDAPYSEGRRSRAWLKQKHRRRERFVVTGWREREGALPEFLLARRNGAAELRPAGSASLGLDAERRARLIGMLAERELPARGRRSSVRWVGPGVEVVADVHGRTGGPVRDAVIRDVLVAPRG